MSISVVTYRHETVLNRLVKVLCPYNKIKKDVPFALIRTTTATGAWADAGQRRICFLTPIISDRIEQSRLLPNGRVDSRKAAMTDNVKHDRLK